MAVPPALDGIMYPRGEEHDLKPTSMFWWVNETSSTLDDSPTEVCDFYMAEHNESIILD